jgi:cytochrome c556
MIRGKFCIAAVIAFIALLVSSQVLAQTDIIEKRQEFMKGNSAAAKAIKGAAEAKDYATIETKAKELMGNSDKIVALFPKDSLKGKTKATPAIWEKSDEFAKAAKNMGTAAGELAAAAKAKDDAAVGEKVKALAGTCGGCHKPFRAEKYPE